MNELKSLILVSTLSLLVSCEGPVEQSSPVATKAETKTAEEIKAPRPDVYADFPLDADLSSLSDGQRQMLVLFIEASQIMDDLFWR